MPKPFDQLKVLLIQARDTADIELQEQVCFQERCKLPAHQFVYANVVRDRMHAGLLDGVDAVMIGGSGEYSATKDYAWMPHLLELVQEAFMEDKPTFGACWGHQVIARALGGTVIHDPEHAEFGCRKVYLTDAGQRDELMGRFPASFFTNMGHQDRVVALPGDAVELADNPNQENQAFRIAGKPIYGTQFHSELDKQREHERLIKYRDLYLQFLGSEAAFQTIIDGLVETSEVDHLMYDFLVHFACNK